jgi:lysyl-tRNA synthetase class 2
MLALGVIALLKGLDFEEAALSFAAAGLLWWGRDAFYVRQEPIHKASPALIALLVIGVGTIGFFAWDTGYGEVKDEFAWGPLAIAALAVGAIVVLTSILFRPLGPPRELPCAEQRDAAACLVRSHGTDTLAFFKLRQDAHYHFSQDGKAFIGYRVANGVLLVAGDPVGALEAVPQLIREVCAFAEVRGLRVAALGASEELLPIYQQAGLRAIYLGDEAIVDAKNFSLEGRWIRKIRQSVNRLETAGYSAEAAELEELGDEALHELEAISAKWRDGEPERGFTMAMDSLRGSHHAGSMIVAARDEHGTIRGFIHFVPSYGRPAMSLSFMRRDRETPNGLMEYLIVKSIELLRDRGVEELSLNFAAFARWIDRPRGRVERAAGRVISLANPFFQIESLHHFNAKFGPRWEPRYLVYERRVGLPRVGLAALRIEGQLPKLR